MQKKNLREGGLAEMMAEAIMVEARLMKRKNQFTGREKLIMSLKVRITQTWARGWMRGCITTTGVEAGVDMVGVRGRKPPRKGFPISPTTLRFGQAHYLGELNSLVLQPRFDLTEMKPLYKTFAYDYDSTILTTQYLQQRYVTAKRCSQFSPYTSPSSANPAR